jgi:hypothetical protein
MTHTICNPNKNVGAFGREAGCQNAGNTATSVGDPVYRHLSSYYMLITSAISSYWVLCHSLAVVLYQLYREMAGTKGHSVRKASQKSLNDSYRVGSRSMQFRLASNVTWLLNSSATHRLFEALSC